jgi:hypothetical protein
VGARTGIPSVGLAKVGGVFLFLQKKEANFQL